MSPEQKARLGDLVEAGVPQYLICRELKVGRGAVQNFRRRNGATGRKPGNPGQVLTPDQESEVLRALASGKGMQRIAAKLDVGEWCIRLVAKKHGFRRGPHHPGYRLPADEQRKILRAIRSRKTTLASIARRSTVSHTTVKKMARREFGVTRFVTGGGAPIRSDFPMKYFREDEHSWLPPKAKDGE